MCVSFRKCLGTATLQVSNSSFIAFWPHPKHITTGLDGMSDVHDVMGDGAQRIQRTHLSLVPYGCVQPNFVPRGQCQVSESLQDLADTHGDMVRFGTRLFFLLLNLNYILSSLGIVFNCIVITYRNNH